MKYLPIILLLVILNSCVAKNGNQVSNPDSKDTNRIFCLWQSINNNDFDNQFYYPEKKLNSNIQIDTTSNRQYSEILWSVDEQIIFNDTTDVESYRFLLIRAFHPTIIIRVERDSNDYKLIFKQKDKVEYLNSIRNLSQNEWNRFIDIVKNENFWTQQSGIAKPLQKDGEYITGTINFDGSNWILEGKNTRMYNVVNTFSPDTLNPIRKICKSLIDLSGFEFAKDEIY